MVKKIIAEEEIPERLQQVEQVIEETVEVAIAKKAEVEDYLQKAEVEDYLKKAEVEDYLKKAEVEDYLQKYQYMRELPLGDPRTDPRGGKAEVMKKALLTQQRVSILVPVESGADANVPLSVTLNGYRLDLPRNTYIEVPMQVAEVVMQSQKQTVQALNQFKTDRSKEIESAL